MAVVQNWHSMESASKYKKKTMAKKRKKEEEKPWNDEIIVEGAETAAVLLFAVLIYCNGDK